MIPLELPWPPPPCANSVFIQQAPFMWQKDGTRWLQACMVLLISKLDKMIVLPWSSTNVPGKTDWASPEPFTVRHVGWSRVLSWAHTTGATLMVTERGRDVPPWGRWAPTTAVSQPMTSARTRGQPEKTMGVERADHRNLRWTEPLLRVQSQRFWSQLSPKLPSGLLAFQRGMG